MENRTLNKFGVTAAVRSEPARGAAVTFPDPFKDDSMAKNQHNPDSTDQALNQNNQMSDDPGDGSRNAFTVGRDGRRTAAEKAPARDEQDQSTIEAFGEEGAGIAPKE
ncbi:MAG TPA: hypothetical protein VK403_10910 [Allosphingosinicella sp.]|nr:hypothetical protein [Allosphingosinicella sp.]